MKTKRNRKLVFFLGGHDAEMLEIRGILESNGIAFFDKNLLWGARLSEYKKEIVALSDEHVPVFIELKLDCQYPERAIIIDHHDRMAGKDKPTSIEQLVQLINTGLSRRQQLIAANDRGHIDAMLEVCATQEEISEIRRLDQDAQGITDEDRRLAKKSLEENLERLAPDAVVIEAQTSHTSPIFDELYNKFVHIFVRTPDKKFCYSGVGSLVYKLKKKYEKIKRKRPDVEFWYGGDLPSKGYFGSTLPIENDEIEKLLKEVRPRENKIFSQHIFMFPFTLTANDKDIPFMQQITETLCDSGWEEASFCFEDEKLAPETRNLRYSEYFYFHGFVRNSIYYRKGDRFQEKDENIVLQVFRRPLKENARFTITLLDGASYKLRINNIYLHVFETQVGILSFELFNYDYPSIDDILRINDFGKRIYPQFLGARDDVIGTKQAFLANCLQVTLDDSTTYEESFPVDKFRRDHLQVAAYIRQLLGDKFRLTGEDSNDNAKYEFKPTIDDRMYVVCWYGSERWSRVLAQRDRSGRYCYETSDMWYRLMYHDGGFLTCQHPEMMRELIENSTYRRWVDYGTFYGITRYSFSCVTDSKDFNYDVIREHMRRHYAQMARLLLAQRASILKFSEEVTNISDEIKKAEGSGGIGQATIDSVEKLHARYIRFVNRLWFTELTPQEQGIEMYHQAVNVMNLKSEIADLKNEIKELYEYVELSYNRQTNKQMNTLTILGAIFLPLMVLTGFFGMNLAFVDPGARELIRNLTAKFPFVEQLLKNNYVWWGVSILCFGFFYWMGLRITKGYLIKMKLRSSRIFKHLEFWNPLVNLFRGFSRKGDRNEKRD